MSDGGSSPTARNDLAELALAQGRLALVEADDEEARRLFAQTLRHQPSPEATAAHLELGRLALAENHSDEARRRFREAEKGAATFESPELLVEVSGAWEALESWQEAAHACHRALDLLKVDQLAEGVREVMLNPTHRFLAASAFMRLSLIADKLNPKDEHRLRYLQAARNLQDPHISPFASIELAVEYSGRLGLSKEADWILNDAVAMGHPVASPEAALELAGLFLRRGLPERAAPLLAEVADTSAQPDLANRARLARDRSPKPFENRARPPRRPHQPPKEARRVLIAGAGRGGQYLAEDLLTDHSQGDRYALAGFVDDNKLLTDTEIAAGAGWKGRLEALDELLKGEPAIDEVWIALPTAEPAIKRPVVEACLAAGITVKTLPVRHEIAEQLPLHRQLRSVEIADIAGDERVDLDWHAGECLRGGRPMIIGCGTLGVQLALCAIRAGADAIVLVDQRERALADLEHLLTSVHGFPRVETHQASSFDSQAIVRYADRHHCDSAFLTVRGWGRSSRGPHHMGPILRGLGELSRDLSDIDALRYFTVVSEVGQTALRTRGEALDLLTETVLLCGQDQDRVKRTAVRIPSLYTSSRSVLAAMARDARYGIDVRVPPGLATCRFGHAYQVAELVLRATDVATSQEVMALDGGNDEVLEALGRWLVKLGGKGNRIVVDPGLDFVDLPRPIGDNTPVPGLVTLYRWTGGPASRAEIQTLADADEAEVFAAGERLHARLDIPVAPSEKESSLREL